MNNNITTADYLNQLLADKATMVSNLQAKGISVTGNETFTELVPTIAEIPTPIKAAVEFYDYDGTLLYSYTKNEALALTTLPTTPSHTGLTFEEWNWTLEEIKSYINTYKDVDVEIIVGATYTTADGKTRFYVTVTKYTLEPALYVQRYGSTNATFTLDWGDGTPIETYTVASASITPTHTYLAPGDYVIEIAITSGKIQFTAGYRSQPLCLIYDSHYTFNGSSYAALGANTLYYAMITKLEFGNDVIIHTNSTSSSIGGATAIYNSGFKSFLVHSANFLTGDTIYDLFSWIAGMKILIVPRNIRKFRGVRGSDFEIVSLPGNLTAFDYDGSNSSLRLTSLKKITYPDTLTALTHLPESPYITKALLPRNLTWSSSQTMVPSNIRELDIYSDFSTTNSPTFGYPLCFDVSSTEPRAVRITYHGDVSKITKLGSKAFYGVDLGRSQINIPISTFTELANQSNIFAGISCEVLDVSKIKTFTHLTSMFYNCHAKKIIMAKDATVSTNASLQDVFSGCICLEEVQLPDTITKFTSTNAFSGNTCLAYIKMPADLIEYNPNTWYRMYSLKVLDFRDSSAVPTLTNTFSVSTYPVLTYLVVPDALYEEWVATAKWVDMASKIIKVSDYDAL